MFIYYHGFCLKHTFFISGLNRMYLHTPKLYYLHKTHHEFNNPRNTS